MLSETYSYLYFWFFCGRWGTIFHEKSHVFVRQRPRHVGKIGGHGNTTPIISRLWKSKLQKRSAIDQSEYNTEISIYLTWICECYWWEKDYSNTSLNYFLSLLSLTTCIHTFYFQQSICSRNSDAQIGMLSFLLSNFWQNSHLVGLITFFGATSGSRKIQMLKKWFLSQAYKCFSTINSEVPTSVMLKLLCSR